MINYTLHDPLWFLALLALPLIFWLRQRRKLPVRVVPFAAAWHRPSAVSVSRFPVVIAVLGLVLLVTGLARPQRVEDRREVRQQGYDLILAVDLSGSMLAEDYQRAGKRINRLQAIKPVITAFINERPGDRIGIVVFSGRAYTLAPLTFDHDWLAKQVERLRIGMIEDGTALGDGLGVALSRLEQADKTTDNQRQGAFVILLTDGANNRGALDPIDAADIARSRGIPVYTIGAGRNGLVHYPRIDPNTGRTMGYRQIVSELDETTLRKVADLTGAEYFPADDSNTIEAAFNAIDRERKIEFEAKSYLLADELFIWFAAPGATLLLIAAGLAASSRPGRRSTAEMLSTA
ncbi:VWA domain-containing protein [Synoicihabitans lomoniglobus]|uniref:VWA domain-containing protein n=1 Tax=Synoicihabitans lomoniglobus TaxID=2909285 RepID=A0AAE9ZV20_9BACT|nr:VWA domain-containing protein [Opitutaceae bacterium LMO-M01]WED62993.1 VWA domain-containing protein [Opitutaceae bacterium LMO-M01]